MVDYNKSSTVIKLAVIGDVHADASAVKVIPNDQIKNFKYTLLGDDAFKFVIELVNYDDAFLTSITKSVNTMVKDVGAPDYTNLDEDNANLKSLPKLLIQFGYEDHNSKEVLSHVHLTNVTDVKYQFTQGQEKILVITSRFSPSKNSDPEDLAAYQSTSFIDIIFPEANRPDGVNCYFKPSQQGAAENSNSKITYHDLVINVVRDLVGPKDGTEFKYLEPDKKTKTAITGIINRAIFKALSHRPEVPEGVWETVKANVASWISPLDNLKEIALTSFNSEFMEHYLGFGEHEWDKLVELSKELKLEFTRRYGHYNPTEEISKAFSGAFDSAMNVGEKLATATGNVILGNTQNSLTDLAVDFGTKLLNGYLASELVYIINNNSGGIAQGNIEQAMVDDGLELDEFGLVPPFNAKILTGYGEQARNILAGKEGVLNVEIINYPSSHVGRKYKVPFNGNEMVLHFMMDNDGNVTTTIDTEAGPAPFADRLMLIADELNEQTTFDKREDLQEVAEAEQEERERIDEERRNPTPEGTGYKLAGLPHSEKRNIFNRDIKVSAISEEGVSTHATAASIIKAYNKLFSADKPEYELEILYHVGTSSGDFNSILLENEGDPKKTRTLHAVIGLKPDITAYKNSLKELEITSSPLTKEDEDHAIIHLDYGRNTSIVKYFDFTGDIRWLRNINTAIVTNSYVDNVYPFLETKTIQKTFTSIVPLLLKDQEFLHEMRAADETLNDAKIDDDDPDSDIKKVLEDLLAQFQGQINLEDEAPGDDYYNGVNALTPEMLKSLSYVEDYIEAGNSAGYLNRGLGDDFKEKMSSFNLFLGGMANTESIKLLMDYKNADQGFVIKPSNVFDKAAQDTRTPELKNALAIYQNNMNMFAEIKIKTLGIPEVTTVQDITQRAVALSVYDPSENNDRKHWLSGLYKITSLSHSITASESYSSELTLLKLPSH